MRTTKNIHGHEVMVSTDESKLLSRITESNSVKESELSPFYQELAEKMYRKSILIREVNNDEVIFKAIESNKG